MRAARKAYEAVRSEIIEGTYAPGDRITESEIAESAQVSRTPVREALHRLEAEGLIRFVPNQGAFVSSFGLAEALETFDLRSMLENYVVRLCADRMTAEELVAARKLAEEQVQISIDRKPGYLRKVADLNSRFHGALLDACRSEPLRATMATIANAPLVFQTFRDYSPDALVRSAQHHLEIVIALESGNAEWAGAVMRAHIHSARSVFLDAAGTD
ncbi:MAG: GntR family transcriptional regulator [Gammaproteobacteria bacterium]